jgi:protein gp37
LDWIIAGGESASGARPPHPDWFRKTRDDCVAAGVPFFFKQWGEFCHYTDLIGTPEWDRRFETLGQAREQNMIRVGKKKAGALLDGREWKEFPKTASEAAPAAARRS